MTPPQGTIDRGTGTAGYRLYQPVSDALLQLDGPHGVRLTARA